MAGDRRCARLLSAAFAVLILLSACSAQPEPEVEETAAPETGETDWVYVPEFTRLADWAGCFALAGERLYFDGVETLASGQETGGAVTRPILRSASALGGEVSDLASFEAAPTPEGASVSGGISCMCALPDGGFAAVERAFFSMPEPMEETSGATSSDLAAGFESAEHILHIFDAAGESRAVKDITEFLGGESFTREDAQLLLAAIDGAKGLYGAQDEELLGIVNEEAGRFFAGDCTAEQCAAVIQDRVSIYINERR